jgi:quercetin dioxygenase-like cupin family protein
MHSHPQYVIYVIAGGKVRTHGADGTTTEAEMKDGDVLYRGPLTHWAENIGTTTIHLILVELKGTRSRTERRVAPNRRQPLPRHRSSPTPRWIALN